MCVISGHYFTIEGDGGYLQDAGPGGVDLRSLRCFSLLIWSDRLTYSNIRAPESPPTHIGYARCSAGWILSGYRHQPTGTSIGI